MDERDQVATLTAEQEPEAPATEQTTEQTAERVPWQQQLAPVEPEASEVEEAGEEGEATDGEGGELVEAHDLDQAADQIYASPEFQAVLDSHGCYDDASKYSLPATFAEIATAEDRPLVEGFLEACADARAPQSFADRVLDMVAEQSIAQRQAQFDADVEHKGQMETILRGEWGNEVQERLDELREFVEGLPGKLGEAMVDARTSDGRRLIDHPEFPLTMSDLIRGLGSPRSNAQDRLQKLMAIHRKDPNRFYREKLDEEAIALRRQTGVERAADEIAGNAPVSRRKAQIQQIMRDDMKRYWADQSLQREYRAILEAEASRGQ
jgi:hypothetical protein